MSQLMMALVLIAVTFTAPQARAEVPDVPAAAPHGATPATPTPQRVGGTYRVKSIERASPNDFTITFESKDKTGRFDELVLVSDHVHMSVDVGSELRLSAEVLSEKGARAEVSQVLLFLPAGDTHVPVWMLSKNYPARKLRGSRYIEMHAPTSDYVVL